MSLLRISLAFTFLLVGFSVHAAEPPQKLWQKMMAPKPSMPQGLSKRTKQVPTELPPKEAAQACIKTAEDLMQNGYDREAIQLFERARQLDPKQVQVCRLLAVCYDRQGDSIHALQEFEKALKRMPKDADLLNDMGYYYYHREDYKQAEHWFRQALERHPDLERAKINLALTLGYQGRFNEAYDLFAEAVGPAAAHSNVGVLLARAERKGEAIDAFHRALEMQPDLPQARACLEALTKPKPLPAPPAAERS
ncbi:MAG: tetratricopeptide repeat protein [Planctomycetes bacterium]|nr:tetratricopeptide repeat protein [Planctomycetota bacterium]